MTTTHVPSRHCSDTAGFPPTRGAIGLAIQASSGADREGGGSAPPPSARPFDRWRFPAPPKPPRDRAGADRALPPPTPPCYGRSRCAAWRLSPIRGVSTDGSAGSRYAAHGSVPTVAGFDEPHRLERSTTVDGVSAAKPPSRRAGARATVSAQSSAPGSPEPRTVETTASSLTAVKDRGQPTVAEPHQNRTPRHGIAPARMSKTSRTEGERTLALEPPPGYRRRLALLTRGETIQISVSGFPWRS